LENVSLLDLLTKRGKLKFKQTKKKHETYKKIITAIIISLIHISVNAQGPNWLWAKSAGGIGGDRVSKTTTDASGNVYVTGFYDSPSITFGTTTLTNLGGGNDMYIVKYAASGNVLWAKGAGGSGIDLSRSISTDNAGNVYLTGHSSSPSIVFGTFTLTNVGSSDIFIVKYDPSGNVLWAKNEGSTGNDYGYSIATDTFNNVYVTGSYDSPSLTLGTYTLTNTGGTDLFIVKYDATGNLLWAKSEGGTSWDYGHNNTTDAFGNVYVTGYFASSSITFGAFTLTNAGSYDMYIVKYDSLGNVLWAKIAGSIGDDEVWSTTTDAAGNVYLTGFYSSPSISFGSTTLNNAGNEDAFVVKYDAAGNVMWAKGIGGTGYDESWGSTTDAAGNVYVTGFYSFSISFGATILTNPDNSGNTADLFMVKYDASGNTLWATGSESLGDDFANSPATDAAGNIYVTGSYNYSMINFGSTSLTGSGNYDMFIAKMQDNCFAHYTSAYDSLVNTFNITVNATTSSLANSYHWDFGDGTTSTLANPSHTYTSDTVYNVCLKIYTIPDDSCEYCHIIGKDYLGNVYNKSNGFSINVNNNLTTGLVSIQEQSGIAIFPNPTNSMVTISSIEKLKEIEIHNIIGDLIYKTSTINKQTTIDLKGQPKGIYYVKTTDNKNNVINNILIVQ